ncbi:hypothetical protein [Commensalibacter oyaizuii]|uniref:Tetratricopeptide repeat protein n=1 Tax=Commensalibacter oyaizuii TaxID=3043873 RepID=A0ABT6PYY5_9PROT|nr:hypothetical protein [Commensalibacter sp. TBRC 16381]MDI2089935.1 hypothetical protein [Commensalibacter sp. TBRC 16381]
MKKLYKHSLLLLPILFGVAACGGGASQEPARDDPFDRTMDVADEAVYYDRLQQAADSYKKSFDYAIIRDDTLNIDDAGYNLAVVQLGLNKLQSALDTVHRTRKELTVRGEADSPQLDLVESAILYRMKQFPRAEQVVLHAQDSQHEDIQERAYFLAALIANAQGQSDKLAQFSQKLDQLLSSTKKKDEPSWKADQSELHALLAYQQGQYMQAISEAKAAEAIRRSQIEYRAMIRVLVLQAQANEKMRNILDAARLYVRAGQSALLLKEYGDAKSYLNKALYLRADDTTYQLAADQLIILAKKTVPKKE